ncbi:MAG: TonB-dependent receptor, partial [Flavobacterium sp.]
QTYHHFYAGARLEMNDSFFHGATIKYQRFSDAFNSAENRLVLKPTFEVEISETKVKTEAIVDYLSGTFARDYEGNLTDLDYGFTNLGIHPSFVMNKEDWTLNIGLAAFYSIASEGDSKFFLYPKINASLNVIENLMIFYAGAEGNLRQNSFRDFTNENPFVSPTFFMSPTDQQYDIFGGLKGKLASNVSYNVRASYMNERGRALFRANPLNPNFVPSERPGYALGNSFDVVYDDLKTLSLSGEVKADINKDFSVGFNGTFNHFTTNNQAEAWNLPAIEIGGNVDVNITNKWFAGAKVFFVGERKDQLIAPDVIDPVFYNFTTVSLKSFFDANAYIGYKHNEQLTGFLRLNNMANQNYQRWLHYPVQGFQVLLGANYKFDF